MEPTLRWMEMAMVEAEQALKEDEVPVGAVFVEHVIKNDGMIDFNEGIVVSSGYNKTNIEKNATRHAEFLALENLLNSDYDTSKPNLYLYVTVEPCVMCSYAMLIGGIKNVVFGCSNSRFGGCGTVLPIHQELDGLKCTKGILETEAIQILKRFYDNENPNAPEDRRKIKIKD
eukprot:TRINITY_DN491_c0_g1_i1.p1 TRINITY_DN491_c0_g1~~TRINITY_DN491_c0_g1_i1.p1  ORF type:complete len:173 (-),score=15.04 TRINITY_DN491_c0_g1_i1:94-612(-)